MSLPTPVEEDISIDHLTAQYFQQVEPHLLNIPEGRVLVKTPVQKAIYERMFNEADLWPIPSVSYRTRVLKIILSRIEESISDPEEDEILDDLMQCWGELVCQPKPSEIQQAQQMAYIKYTAPNSDPDSPHPRTIITSESRGLILSSGTTGFRTWEAALHLGSFLSTPAGASLVRAKNIIELGAGTGFLSMFCAKHLGPHSVVVTDREPALIDNIRDCVDRNQLDRESFHPAIWEWGTPLHLQYSSDTSGNLNMTFDVALGADLIYDVDLVPLLISTIQDLFTNYQVQEFIISATLRNQDTFQAFLDACETNHFIVECIPFESPSAEAQTGFFHATSIPIRMYRILKRLAS